MNLKHMGSEQLKCDKRKRNLELYLFEVPVDLVGTTLPGDVSAKKIRPIVISFLSVFTAGVGI